MNSSKCKKIGADRVKQIFPCNNFKQFGIWPAQYPQKRQHVWDRVGKLCSRKNADAFPLHIMRDSSANILEADSLYCDSGAIRHITPNKYYFVSYTKFPNSETTVLSNKNVLMQAYGQGIINVQSFHNGVCHGAKLKDVFNVQDVSVHLFSVKAAAKNGYITTLKEKETVIRNGDGTIAEWGMIINDFYSLAFRVCIPRHFAVVQRAM